MLRNTASEYRCGSKHLYTGETNIIKKVGGSPEVKKHLENLGFVAGGEVTVISSLGGNVIVNVKETRCRN